jgi:hypothetical protein
VELAAHLRVERVQRGGTIERDDENSFTLLQGDSLCAHEKNDAQLQHEAVTRHIGPPAKVWPQHGER